MKTRASLIAGSILFLLGIGLYAAQVNGFFDFFQIATPANPATGQARVYVNSGTGFLSCLKPDGSTCMPTGGGGSGTPTLPTGTTAVLTTTNFGGSDVFTTHTAYSNMNIAANSGDILRIAEQAAPSEPWTLTINVSAFYVVSETDHIGISLRESATGKVVGLSFYGQGAFIPALEVINWNNVSGSFSSRPFNNASFFTTGFYWLRVVNDGTNLVYQFSYDGDEWKTVLTTLKTAFFTVAPNFVGVYVDPNGADPVGVNILSFTATSP
jgi:hypothetical protein